MPRRIAEHGRIRIGVKTARAMKTIDTFRFTSTDRESILKLAELYGGAPKVWEPGKSRSEWEVITEASQINVVLPPDPLGESPIYEVWSGGGLVRRCDGEQAEIPQQTPDGTVVQQVPCICSAKQQLICEPHTRLSVLLPELPFMGVWRLDTKSENAAREMPGMVDMIQEMQGRGLPFATLRIVPIVKPGKTFNVPRLGLPVSINDMIEGRVRVLGAGEQPALGAPKDEVVEAELVDENDIAEQKRQQVLVLMARLNLDEEAFAGFARAVSDLEHQSVTELPRDQLDRVLKVLMRIANRDVEYVGCDDEGRAVVRKVSS